MVAIHAKWRANLSKIFLTAQKHESPGQLGQGVATSQNNPIWDIVFSPEGQAVVKGTDT